MIRSKLVAVALAAALGLGLSGAGHAQRGGYSAGTGDAWLDGRLGEVNQYGHSYRDPFVSEVVTLGAPRSLVVELLDGRGWAPADIYMACQIASVLGIECGQVVERYDADPGHGWGRIAQDMGIKPGSAEFHALKRGTVSTYDRWGYPIQVDSSTRIDWSDGPRGRGQPGGGASQGRGSQGNQANKGNQGSQGNRGNQGNQGNRDRGN